MGEKIFWLAFVWGCVIVGYLILAAIMPALTDIAAVASDEMGNLTGTGIVGVKESVESSPYWFWFIPGLVGTVTSVLLLIQKP